jgi:uncharacterized protein YndB with AHSA1/START domain
MPNRSAKHASFVIERKLEAPLERVFHAFADKNAKARWFAGPPEWEGHGQEFDFQAGGRGALERRPERRACPFIRCALPGHRAQ